MPCGGIHTAIKGPGTIFDKLDPTQGGCWVCGRGGCHHFYDEFDTFIHASCALTPEFLDEEGTFIQAHKHSMFLDFSLEDSTLEYEKAVEMLKNFSREELQQILKMLKKDEV